MGRLSLVTGQEGVGKDVLPFVTVKNRYTVLGINVIGMRRAGHRHGRHLDRAGSAFTSSTGPT